MSFDPKSLGCLCDSCPLSARKPVPPELRPSAALFIIGDGPGPDDVEDQKTFSGKAGRLLERTLQEAGFDRDEVSLSNVILCQPKSKMTAGEQKAAIAACKPRVDAEIAASKAVVVLTLGELALQGVADKRNIFAWAGAPIEAEGKSMLPAFAPHWVRQQANQPYMSVWVTHVERAALLARGELPKWEWPRILVDPDETMLQGLRDLLKAEEPLGLDVETRDIDVTSDLHCIGFANSNLAVSVPFPFSDPEIAAAATALLASDLPKVFHNGQFDRAVFHHNGLTVNGPIEDSLLLHVVTAPGLKHGLGFAGASEFHANAWKSEHKAGADEKGLAKFRDDAETRDYNAKDSFIQRRLFDVLSARLDTDVKNGRALYEEYKALDLIAEDMKLYGVALDFEVLAWRSGELQNEVEKRQRNLTAILEKLGLGHVNWGSPKQVNKLFFQTLGVTPKKWTATGQPSVDEEGLNDIIASDHAAAALIARELKELRSSEKLLSTFIEGLRNKSRDGRIHFNWKPWGTITGRWSSTPNAQNIPQGVRDIFQASPGLWMVAADFSQLEVRILALQAKEEKLLEAYAKNLDVYTFAAQQVFKTKHITKQQRQLAKTAALCFNYGGSAYTAWTQLILFFPDITLAVVEALQKKWFETFPAIKTFHESTLTFARAHKFVEEPLSGRRRHFFGKVKPTEALNFKIQTMGATIMNKAIRGIKADLRDDEHLLFQVHDELVLEGPLPGRLSEILLTHMQQTLDFEGARMFFKIECKRGLSWSECK